MKIGFIGAGKMGYTLGKHLRLYEDILKKDDNSLYHVEGYYSRSLSSAIEAAKFTDTKYYESMEELVCKCDTLILTVPDSQIYVMADMLAEFGGLIKDKIIIHTSGALSSQIFSGMDGIYAYSIHPIYAVSSKTESYKNFKEAFITIEGNDKYIGQLSQIFESIGHRVKVMSAKDKVKYHSAAVFASNLVIGLYNSATELLCQCGFSDEEAGDALKPLFKNNADRLFETNPQNALTGPIERCDYVTIENHTQALEGDALAIYKLLSKQLVDIAIKKHKDIYNADGYNKILDILS